MASKKFSKKKQNKDPGEMSLEEVKKAIENAKLQVLALNTLIDVAEEKYNISIRPKPGNIKPSR